MLLQSLVTMGKTLYFAMRSDDKTNMPLYNGDAWYSTRNSAGEWEPKKNLSAPINNEEAKLRYFCYTR